MRTGSVIQKKASSEIEGKDGASEKTKSPRMNSWDRFVFVKTFSRISPQVENISSSKRENCRRGGYYAVRLGYCDIEIWLCIIGGICGGSGLGLYQLPHFVAGKGQGRVGKERQLPHNVLKIVPIKYMISYFVFSIPWPDFAPWFASIIYGINVGRRSFEINRDPCLKVVGFEGLGRCVTMRASRWGRPPHRGAHE